MKTPDTVRALLDAGADDAVAIAAPDRAPLTFSALRHHVDATIDALNRNGVGRNDRVAIVLPNGPDMASAFLSIACAATTAPLNPAYRAEEFDFYLSDLNARALVVEAGGETPARDVAMEHGIPVYELAPDRETAGVFRLDGPNQARAVDGGPAAPDDVGLVLHTSGTTSRPKIVPLSHINLCASARHIGTTLALTREDRCLNVMPLFHIHGLIAAVLSSIAAAAAFGARRVQRCAFLPGFRRPRRLGTRRCRTCTRRSCRALSAIARSLSKRRFGLFVRRRPPCRRR